MRTFLMAAVVVAGLHACVSPSVTDAGFDASVGGGTGGGGAGGGTGAPDAGPSLELLAKLAGLWSGPATMTPLGTFPLMTFDLRPVDSQFVFGQTELDAADTLRFGFSVETYGGRDVLAYRNGGYFQGVLRDSRTQLVEADGGTWRFCSVLDAGCSYLDARWTVNGDSLVLNTKVRGAQHLVWNAQRVETRPVGPEFPSDARSRGDGSAPWPTLATVQVNATFGATTAGPADVWLLLTTTACFPSFSCHASRSVMVGVDGGVGQAALSLPSVHAGAYKVSVVLDRDRNFGSLLAPSSGDRVAVDQDLLVGDAGVATVNVTTAYQVP